MQPTPLDIQGALEAHIASFQESARALNKSETLGPEGDPNSTAIFWVAYESSDWNFQQGPDPQRNKTIRTMNFSSYVEVRDLQRDYRRALQIHEELMTLVNAFIPKVSPDIDPRSYSFAQPFRVRSDRLLPVRTEKGPRYRYQAQYNIQIQYSNIQSPGLVPFQATEIRMGLFRSPTNQVGAEEPVSTKDADLVFVSQE